MEQQRPSVWRLRWDLASTQLFIWVATRGGRAAMRPEIHLYLADRYGRLARHYDRRGDKRRAERLDRVAAHHFRLGCGDQPPPAVAVAMPRPKAPMVVDAVARPEPAGPDDAA